MPDCQLIIDVIIKHKRFHEAEPFALWMNADLIQIIKNNTDPRLQLPAQAFDNLCSQLLVWQDEVTEWDKKNNCNMKGRHIVAGKNAASFDKPKLLKLASRVGGEKAVKRLSELWSYKTLDLGSAFFPYYGYMPSLSEINKDFTGRAPVSHNALDDAWDVVYGTRKLFELRSEDE